MKPADRELALFLERQLRRHSHERRALLGIAQQARLSAFIEQLLESNRRIRYIQVIRNMQISPLRADPTNDIFHPIKAAILMKAKGNKEEAIWLTFLSVHFGRNHKTGWRLLRDVYGGLGQGVVWNWRATSEHPRGFRAWLDAHTPTLQGGDGVERHFGNHRKYQSLDAWSVNGTGHAIESYVTWVGAGGSQDSVFANALESNGGDAYCAFDQLYRNMDVASFGRTARFDFLTMVGKLGLAAIEPPSTYLKGATGPLTGARLLYGGDGTAALGPSELEAWLVELGQDLRVGMQVLEDALCNWQKRPDRFIPFRG